MLFLRFSPVTVNLNYVSTGVFLRGRLRCRICNYVKYSVLGIKKCIQFAFFVVKHSYRWSSLGGLVANISREGVFRLLW